MSGMAKSSTKTSTGRGAAGRGAARECSTGAGHTSTAIAGGAGGPSSSSRARRPPPRRGAAPASADALGLSGVGVEDEECDLAAADAAAAGLSDLAAEEDPGAGEEEEDARGAAGGAFDVDTCPAAAAPVKGELPGEMQMRGITCPACLRSTKSKKSHAEWRKSGYITRQT